MILVGAVLKSREDSHMLFLNKFFILRHYMALPSFSSIRRTIPLRIRNGPFCGFDFFHLFRRSTLHKIKSIRSGLGQQRIDLLRYRSLMPMHANEVFNRVHSPELLRSLEELGIFVCLRRERHRLPLLYFNEPCYASIISQTNILSIKMLRNFHLL